MVYKLYLNKAVKIFFLNDLSGYRSGCMCVRKLYFINMFVLKIKTAAVSTQVKILLYS